MPCYEHRPVRRVVEMDERVYRAFLDVCAEIFTPHQAPKTPYERGQCIDALVAIAERALEDKPVDEWLKGD